MKKLVALLLVAVMALSCVSALAETTISAIWRLPATFIVEGNPVIKAWGDRTGVTLDVEAPPISNYSDRLNIVMASGELPDMIYVQNFDTNFQQWARDGLLLDLTDYLTPEKMPIASSVLTADELAASTVDGRLYAFPRVQTKPLDCILYRGDWLEKLGLDIPTTPEEFANVMHAFATMDPDGNGLDDTYGFYMRNWEDRNLIYGFDVRPTSVPNENGEYEMMQNQEHYMEFMDWLHDMYAEGSLHPEWYLATAYEDQDLFYAGKVGAVYVDIIINHLITFANNDTFKAANPDGYLVAGPALHPAGVETSNVYYPPQVWGGVSVNADSANIDAVIKLIDDAYSDECTTLLFKGIEGQNYISLDPVTRVITATPEQTSSTDNILAASYLTVNYQLQNKGMIIAGGTSSTPEELEKWLAADAFVSSIEKRVSYLGENIIPGVSDANAKLSNDGIYAELNSMRTKYICGQIERDELVNFLTNVYAPACQELMSIISASGINK